MGKFLTLTKPVTVEYFLDYSGEDIDLMAKQENGSTWHVLRIEPNAPLHLYCGLPGGLGIMIDDGQHAVVTREGDSE
jgi:hypothetical protein